MAVRVMVWLWLRRVRVRVWVVLVACARVGMLVSANWLGWTCRPAGLRVAVARACWMVVLSVGVGCVGVLGVSAGGVVVVGCVRQKWL